jgi:flagellar hook-length control protein FliK
MQEKSDPAPKELPEILPPVGSAASDPADGADAAAGGDAESAASAEGTPGTPAAPATPSTVEPRLVQDPIAPRQAAESNDPPARKHGLRSATSEVPDATDSAEDPEPVRIVAAQQPAPVQAVAADQVMPAVRTISEPATESAVPSGAGSANVPSATAAAPARPQAPAAATAVPQPQQPASAMESDGARPDATPAKRAEVTADAEIARERGSSERSPAPVKPAAASDPSAASRDPALVRLHPGSDGPAADWRLGIDPSANASRGEAANHAVRPRYVAEQVAAAVKTARDGGPVELRLDPPELGRVQIHLVTTDDGARVVVMAERADTHDLLRRHAEMLARDLSDAGFDTVSLDFSQGREAADQRSERNEAAFAAATGVAEAAEAPERSATPGVRLSGLDIRL